MDLQLSYKEGLDPVNRKVYDIFASFYPRTQAWVETGCNDGNSILKAIHIGFKAIYSCDISESAVRHCSYLLEDYSEKFDFFGDVEHNNSVDFLKNLLPNLLVPTLFWLDAHDANNNGTWNELEVIKQYFIKGSCIIIDDLPEYFAGQYDLLEQKLLEINPEFQLEYMDTREKQYILVAS